MKETRSDFMRLRVGLESYKVEAKHGWFDFELEKGQPFIFTVWVELRATKNLEELEQTVDYGQIQEIIDKVVLGSEKPFRLLESMAQCIIEKLRTKREVQKIFVRIEKPEAPLPKPIGLPYIELTWKK